MCVCDSAAQPNSIHSIIIKINNNKDICNEQKTLIYSRNYLRIWSFNAANQTVFSSFFFFFYILPLEQFMLLSLHRLLSRAFLFSFVFLCGRYTNYMHIKSHSICDFSNLICGPSAMAVREASTVDSKWFWQWHRLYNKQQQLPIDRAKHINMLLVFSLAIYFTAATIIISTTK